MAGGCEAWCYIDIGVDVIRPAVEQKDRYARRRAGFRIGDVEVSGLDPLQGPKPPSGGDCPKAGIAPTVCIAAAPSTVAASTCRRRTYAAFMAVSSEGFHRRSSNPAHNDDARSLVTAMRRYSRGDRHANARFPGSRRNAILQVRDTYLGWCQTIPSHNGSQCRDDPTCAEQAATGLLHPWRSIHGPA